MAPLAAASERDRMAAYNDKEPVVPTHLNAVPPSDGLSVVKKQTDQTPNDSSASSPNGLTKSESLQASLQSSIEHHSPARIGILDLADELLMNVFEQAADSADIRNIRLTCGRFCSTSSHLLLDCLDICLTATSLARIKDISCHPAISKGIRILHISLQSLSHLPSSSQFLSSAIRYLQTNFNLVMSDHHRVFANGNFTSFAEFSSIFRERQRLMSFWYQYRAEQGRSRHLDPQPLSGD